MPSVLNLSPSAQNPTGHPSVFTLNFEHVISCWDKAAAFHLPVNNFLKQQVLTNNLELYIVCPLWFILRSLYLSTNLLVTAETMPMRVAEVPRNKDECLSRVVSYWNEIFHCFFSHSERFIKTIFLSLIVGCLCKFTQFALAASINSKLQKILELHAFQGRNHLRYST